MNTEIQLCQLCDDIIRDIYSFGYPNHRVYMKDICKRIESNHDTLDKYLSDSWYQNSLHDNHNTPMDIFIKTQFTQTEMVNMFNYYKKCRCCTRHSYYKPDIKRQHFNPKPEYNPHYTNDTTCLCTCRHMSRHLYSASVNYRSL